MKKINLFLLLITCSAMVFAQAPQIFKYQAVARDNLGRIIQNQIVGLRISILKDSPLGATMYMETHSKGTNEFGIVTLNVGGGTIVTGSFNTINWSNGEYFIKTELDIAGTGSYEFIGTTQLLSVPFAIYANEAGKAKNDNDTSATNELQTIVKTGNTVTLSQNGGSFDLTEYIDNTDNQTLSLSDPTHLTISNGNTIQLSAGLADLDADSTNEIQNLTLSNDTLNLSKANQVVFPHDADRDSTNEIQQFQLNHNTLSLTKGNTITIDADTTNEIQLLSKNNNVLNISKGNSVVIDADTTNEIQTLSLSKDTLRISKGNYVVFEPPLNFPDGLSNIEPITIYFNGTNSYTIPIGKNLYITHVSSVLYINSIVIMPIGEEDKYNLLNPIIVGSGDVVFMNNAGSIFNGFLVDSKVTPLTISSSYTVPIGKKMFVTNIIKGTSGWVQINGHDLFFGTYLNNATTPRMVNCPIVLKEGDIINITTTGWIINGYLK